MPVTRRTIFISSTAIDLPDHRAKAIEACRTMGFEPLCMEAWPPDPRDAVTACLDWVDHADLYLGLYAHRYGYCPPGSDKSLTEMEYDRAMDRGIPVYLFVVDTQFPWLPDQIDDGEAKARLQRFKDRLAGRHVFRKFRDEGSFQKDVFALLREIPAPAGPLAVSGSRRRTQPSPPAMYSVPPYILGNRFVGRKKELAGLDKWAGSADPVLVVEAIGGVGKSALTWEWARERAAKAIPDLSGLFWFTFYETGATLGKMVREALAYVRDQDPEELKRVPRDELAAGLLAELRRRPFLLVLDGLERVLAAYHRLEPGKLRDDQVEGDLRTTTSPRDGELLRQLTTASPSKVLVSTRLLPRAFQNQAHGLLPGVRHQILRGLHPDDAGDLLAQLGVHGGAVKIKELLAQFEYHSLLITVLAGRIRDYLPAPGYFDRWLADPQAGGSLHLAQLDLKQRRNHILAYALEGLEPEKRQLLSRIAVFSDGVDYETVAILNPYLPPAPEEVDEPAEQPQDYELWSLEWDLESTSDSEKREQLTQQIAARRAVVETEHTRQKAEYAEYRKADEAYRASAEYHDATPRFREALHDLEGRGLLSWDREAPGGLFDLHPVVRGFAFDLLEEGERISAYERIRDHFERQPPEDAEEATELADLKNTLQIYRALTGAGQIERALYLYRGSVARALLYSIGSYPTVIELLRPLFPNGFDNPPALERALDRSYVVGHLASALDSLGRAREALPLFAQTIAMDLESEAWGYLATSLRSYGISSFHLGHLAQSARASELGLQVAQAAWGEEEIAAAHFDLMSLFIPLGRWERARQADAAFSALPKPGLNLYRPGDAEYWRAWMGLAQGTLTPTIVESALTVAEMGRAPENVRHLNRLLAELALEQVRPGDAMEPLERALALAARSGAPPYREQAVMARVLGELGRAAEAKDLLDELLAVEEPEHLLRHRVHLAHACLALGDLAGARELTLQAYRDAWADGPPYSFWWELQQAKKLLARLGVPEPEVPSFDPAKIEPIPYEKEILAVIARLEKDKAGPEALEGAEEAEP